MFVGNRLMTRLNSLYRGVNRNTDVLSFPLLTGPLSGPPDMLGDIVVCIPKTVSQSKQYNVTFYDELLRLLIHGLLHLTGYDHEKNAFQKARMEKKERELLDAVQEVD
jgi:probable rRNA maturation factor